MVSRLSIILIALLFALIACNEDNNTDNSQNEKYVHIPPSLPDTIYDNLQEGDIIIRKGGGPLSFHLMNYSKEEYTHSGILVREGGEWIVIHTIGGTSAPDAIDGMQSMKLVDFVPDATDSMLFICRPIFIDSAGPKIAERARHYLDLEVPFDHRFSVFTTDELYCTELLFYIFRDIGGKDIFVIEKKHKSYMLMFSTFFREKNFKPLFHLKD